MVDGEGGGEVVGGVARRGNHDGGEGVVGREEGPGGPDWVRLGLCCETGEKPTLRITGSMTLDVRRCGGSMLKEVGD